MRYVESDVDRSGNDRLRPVSSVATPAAPGCVRWLQAGPAALRAAPGVLRLLRAGPVAPAVPVGPCHPSHAATTRVATKMRAPALTQRLIIRFIRYLQVRPRVRRRRLRDNKVNTWGERVYPLRDADGTFPGPLFLFRLLPPLSSPRREPFPSSAASTAAISIMRSTAARTWGSLVATMYWRNIS